MAKYTSIGGQALIEGILMKSPEKTAMAVRKPNGEIDLSFENDISLRNKYKILKLPVLRGVAAFIESLIGGYKAMMKSAEISGFTDFDEEEEKEKPIENETEKAETTETTEEIENAEKPKEEKEDNGALMAFITVIGSVLGVALAVVLFMFLPRLAVGGLELLFGKFSPVLRAATEQVIKLAVLVIYIWAISFMKDIKRVFMFHGAEHKTIFCYEHGKELTVENVMKERRFHPRCGTSFMILMILVSFVVSLCLQLIFKGVYDNKFVWVAVKIIMIPVVCGLGFEVLKICGKYDNLLTKIIAAPGLWLQRITTKEPEADMVEVAIAALKACEPEVPDVDRSIDKKEQDNGEKTDGQIDI